MLINSNSIDLSFCPYIDTEKTIIDQLKISSETISDEFELIPFPLAHMINTWGIHETNNFIRNIKSFKKRVFICQHIHVNNINFLNDDVVFTPHATINDNFNSIPHFAVNQNKDQISSKKDYLFSFLGSTKTHPTRNQLTQIYPDNCFDSGEKWGLDSNDSNFKNRYISLLGNSTFSICPRGTGISSVRLFESMAMNSIPVIIADDYKKPLHNKIDWDSFSITIPENEIDNLYNILNEIPQQVILKMRIKLDEVYEKYFSNKNLSKTIIETI